MKSFLSFLRIAFVELAASLVVCLLGTTITYGQQLGTGDVNGDGQPLNIADFTHLLRFVNFEGPPPVPLYQGDLNGDCVIDYADLDVLACYFSHGLSCFPQYPIPTCDVPDTVRGACCDSLRNCFVRSPGNCTASGGTYRGNGVSCIVGNPCALCGDLNEDGTVDISDVVHFVFCIFACDPMPPQGEVNCDGIIDISDVVYLVMFIFGGGPAPCEGCR